MKQLNANCEIVNYGYNSLLLTSLATSSSSCYSYIFFLEKQNLEQKRIGDSLGITWNVKGKEGN